MAVRSIACRKYAPSRDARLSHNRSLWMIPFIFGTPLLPRASWVSASYNLLCASERRTNLTWPSVRNGRRLESAREAAPRSWREFREKITTIGDAYMAAEGSFNPQLDHLAAMTTMALAMLDRVGKLKEEFGELSLRIELHTGRVPGSYWYPEI